MNKSEKDILIALGFLGTATIAIGYYIMTYEFDDAKIIGQESST